MFEMKFKKHNSSWDKRMELHSTILNSGWEKTTNEWFEEHKVDLHTLTDNDIDKIIWAINESKS